MNYAPISNSKVAPTFMNFATDDDCGILRACAPDINDLADEYQADSIYIEKPKTTWGGIRVAVVRFRRDNKVVKTRCLSSIHS